MSTFLHDKNNIIVIGHNGYDCHIDNNKINKIFNQKFAKNGVHIKAIDSSIFFCIILTKNNQLYTFGNYCDMFSNKSNDFSKLGTINENIKSIKCGTDTLAILENNGDLYVWGNNIYNKINKSLIEPTVNLNHNYIESQSLLMKNVKLVACGYGVMLILKNNGELFGLMENKSEKLLMMDKEINFICGGSGHFLILKNNGDLFCWRPFLNNSFKIIMKNSEIKQICCGKYHSLILTNSGELFVFGDNLQYQLSLNEQTDTWIPILLMVDIDIDFVDAGYDHSVIVKNNGDVFVFGNNARGCLIANNKDICIKVPTLLMTNPNIKSLTNPRKWKCENHKSFPLNFRLGIWTFLLCMKRNQVNTGLKIPKFVLFEIIKFTV